VKPRDKELLGSSYHCRFTVAESSMHNDISFRVRKARRVCHVLDVRFEDRINSTAHRGVFVLDGIE